MLLPKCCITTTLPRYGAFPKHRLFQLLEKQMPRKSRIFIVTYKDKVIGGSVCIYSNNSAYLWFSGGMRKTYALQYPGILAVWQALHDAKKTRLPPPGIYGRRPAFPQTRLPRIRTPLRRKTNQHPSLVPFSVGMAEQGADKDV